MIDRTFRNRKTGKTERYRRASKIQRKPEAEAEEQNLIKYWVEHGTIAPFLGTSEPEPPSLPKTGPVQPRTATWDDAVQHFRENVLAMKKPSTRKGYLALLVAPGFVWWAGTNLADIDNEAIKAWDMRLHSTGISESTRRNHHILLRSILRSVGPDEDGKPGKYIETLPRFPRLPKVGKKSVDAADPEDVRRLIFEVDLPNCYWAAQRQAARLAFALAAWAGLRASEVRGLRRRDVDLKRAEITVRLARCNGEESSPKSGHERVIPISTPLLKLLEARCKVLKPAEYVAARSDGQPWGDYGLCQAMARACKRLSIEGGRYHALRHYFATALFAGNTDAKTVQALLGHSSLEVTSRYAHHLKERGRRAVQVFA